MNQHHTAQCRIDSPLGNLTAARSVAGLAGLWFDGQRHHPGVLTAPAHDADPLFVRLKLALDAYFAGQPFPPDVLAALDPVGTDFQREVWRALLQIPPGVTVTYGGLAQQLGRPRAVRALGAAVGRNPVSILVPCHRVVGQGGALTGYAGGLDRKAALLRLEGASFQAG